MKKLLVFLMALVFSLSACNTSDGLEELTEENEELKSKLTEEKKEIEEKEAANTEEVNSNDDIEKQDGLLVSIDEVPFTIKDIAPKYNEETDVALTYKNNSKYSIVEYTVLFINTAKKENYYVGIYDYTTKPGELSIIGRSPDIGKAKDLKAYKVNYSVFDGSQIYDISYNYELDSYETNENFRGFSKDNEVKASKISYEILPVEDELYNFKIAINNDNNTPLTSASLYFRDTSNNENVYILFHHSIGANKKSTYANIYDIENAENLELYRTEYSYMKDGEETYAKYDNILDLYFE